MLFVCYLFMYCNIPVTLLMCLSTSPRCASINWITYICSLVCVLHMGSARLLRLPWIHLRYCKTEFKLNYTLLSQHKPKHHIIPLETSLDYHHNGSWQWQWYLPFFSRRKCKGNQTKPNPTTFATPHPHHAMTEKNNPFDKH